MLPSFLFCRAKHTYTLNWRYPMHTTITYGQTLSGQNTIIVGKVGGRTVDAVAGADSVQRMFQKYLGRIPTAVRVILDQQELDGVNS